MPAATGQPRAGQRECGALQDGLVVQENGSCPNSRSFTTENTRGLPKLTNAGLRDRFAFRDYIALPSLSCPDGKTWLGLFVKEAARSRLAAHLRGGVGNAHE